VSLIIRQAQLSTQFMIHRVYPGEITMEKTELDTHELAKLMHDNVEVKDRTYHFKNYPQVCVIAAHIVADIAADVTIGVSCKH
jgi:hypothetical protein